MFDPWILRSNYLLWLALNVSCGRSVGLVSCTDGRQMGVNMCDHLSTRSAMIVFVPASQRDQETTSGRLSCVCICGGGPNPSGFFFREAPMVLRGDYALLLPHDFTATKKTETRNRRIFDGLNQVPFTKAQLHLGVPGGLR